MSTGCETVRGVVGVVGGRLARAGVRGRGGAPDAAVGVASVPLVPLVLLVLLALSLLLLVLLALSLLSLAGPFWSVFKFPVVRRRLGESQDMARRCLSCADGCVMYTSLCARHAMMCIYTAMRKDGTSVKLTS